MLEGDKPIICAGPLGAVQVDGWISNVKYWPRKLSPEEVTAELNKKDHIDLGKRYWSMGEEEPCAKCNEPMFYTKSCWRCPSCGFFEGCG